MGIVPDRPRRRRDCDCDWMPPAFASFGLGFLAGVVMSLWMLF